MTTENYEPEMRIDKLADKCDRLQRALIIAQNALQYCALNPAIIQPAANSQHAVALNTLAEIREILGESK